MNTATNEAVALLKELIAIPSFSREETAVADKIADFIGSKVYLRFIIFCVARPAAGITLLLLVITDVNMLTC